MGDTVNFSIDSIPSNDSASIADIDTNTDTDNFSLKITDS